MKHLAVSKNISRARIIFLGCTDITLKKNRKKRKKREKEEEDEEEWEGEEERERSQIPSQ